MSSSKAKLLSAPTSTKAYDEFLARVNALPALECIPLIDHALKTLPPEATDANIFFRKKLLRIQDWSRLEAGLVTPAELQRENSPFPEGAFKDATLKFRPRLRRA